MITLPVTQLGCPDIIRIRCLPAFSVTQAVILGCESAFWTVWQAILRLIDSLHSRCDAFGSGIERVLVKISALRLNSVVAPGTMGWSSEVSSTARKYRNVLAAEPACAILAVSERSPHSAASLRSVNKVRAMAVAVSYDRLPKCKMLFSPRDERSAARTAADLVLPGRAR